jgi:anti-sigma regulatory factor (Ser/Thr protein kinase)/ABC-type transporter Mla MlaB component
MCAFHGVGDVGGALDAYEADSTMILAFDGPELRLASANATARTALGDRVSYGHELRDVDVVDPQAREAAGRVLTTGEDETSSGWRFSPRRGPDGQVCGVVAYGVHPRTTFGVGEGDGLHDVLTLQDTLLPGWLPVLPGLEVSGRYLLAPTVENAGGEWFDAVGLPDGRIALVVGDAAGQGVPAAALMGQLRSVVRERLLAGAGVTGALEAGDTYARGLAEAAATTVCIAVVDPVSREVEYCTAGHPPPLVVPGGGGAARFLPGTGAAPLATTTGATFLSGSERLEAHDLLVLYTNGLVRMTGEKVPANTVELGLLVSDLASRGPAELADWVCEQTMERLASSRAHDDDATMLVAELTDEVAPLRLRIPADQSALLHVHSAVGRWLDDLHVRDLDHIVVQHSVNVLVSNIIDHAYDVDAPGDLRLDAQLLPEGHLELRVEDSGRWTPTETGGADHRGGLTVVRGMVDRLDVQTAETGTRVTVRHRLSRPAYVLSGSGQGAPDQSAELDAPFTMDREPHRLRLTGSMGNAHVDDLRVALERRAPLPQEAGFVVDISGVTRLPSAAVGVLYQAQEEATSSGQALVLFAPAGTTGQQVLELVRLPYTTTDPRTGSSA